MLVEHGYKVTAIDNLDNAFEEVLNRLKKLAGDKADNLNFVKVQNSTLPAGPSKVENNRRFAVIGKTACAG